MIYINTISAVNNLIISIMQIIHEHTKCLVNINCKRRAAQQTRFLKMKSLVFRSIKNLNKSIMNFQNSFINGVYGLIDFSASRGIGFQLIGSQPQSNLQNAENNDLQTMFDSILLFAVPKKKVT